MKRIIIGLIILTVTGCVNSEIGEGPEKMKTATVWSSDLRLNYDNVYSREAKRDREYNYTDDYDEDYKADEYLVTLVTEEIEEAKVEVVEIKEVGSEEVDKLLEGQMKKKIAEDEKVSKGLKDMETLNTEKNEDNSQKTKWFIALTAFTTLGGFFNSFSKKSKKQDKK